MKNSRIRVYLPVSFAYKSAVGISYSFIMGVNLIVLAPPLKIMIFTMGCLCMVFMAVALHADREFNQHMDSAKDFLLNTVLVDPAGFQATDLSLGRVLYDYAFTKYHLVDANAEDKAARITDTIDGLKRPTDFGVVILGIVGVLTLITGLSVVSRVPRMSEVTLGYFSEVFYGLSCFGYTVAFILGMSSALKNADISASKPFGCMTSAELNLENLYICQLYGLKIFAGICALAAAVVSAMLVVIFVIFKPTPMDLENDIPIPHQSNFEYRMPAKIFGKLLDMSDLENDNVPLPVRNDPSLAKTTRIDID